MAYASAADIRPFPVFANWSTGVVAGLAGGSAEIAWIGLYERLSGGEAATVASGVAHTFFPQLVAFPAVAFGLVIHVALSILVGVVMLPVLHFALPFASGWAAKISGGMVFLSAIWAANFFLLLPAFNPAFVTIVPLEVSLVSKLLFGLAAALVLHFGTNHRSLVAGMKGD